MLHDTGVIRVGELHSFLPMTNLCHCGFPFVFPKGDDPEYHPAPWISGHLQESQPTYIWYWMREGPYKLPRSCMEVQFRGLQTNPVKGNVFKATEISFQLFSHVLISRVNTCK